MEMNNKLKTLLCALGFFVGFCVFSNAASADIYVNAGLAYDEDIGEDGLCLGYDLYGDATDPFTDEEEDYESPDYPTADYIYSTEIFGKDIMAQISEDALNKMARAYFFENIDTFSFEESTSILGIPVEINGGLIDLNLEISEDNELTIQTDIIVVVSDPSSSNAYSISGTTTLTSGVIIETGGGGAPEAVVVDSPALSDSEGTYDVYGYMGSLPASDVEDAINPMLETAFSGLRIPVSDYLTYLTEFVNPGYGTSITDVGVKLVKDTYLEGDDPFLMIGMNIYSGAASGTEDDVFDNFNHNMIEDDGLETTTKSGFAGDNDDTNIVIAMAPYVFRTLSTYIMDTMIPVPYSSGDFTLSSIDSTFAYWAGEDASCPNRWHCWETRESGSGDLTGDIQCGPNPIVNQIGIVADGTYSSWDLDLEAQLVFDIESTGGANFLAFDPEVTYLDVDLPWYYDLLAFAVEVLTFTAIDIDDIIPVIGEIAINGFLEDQAIRLEFQDSDDTWEMSFHTLRENEYEIVSTGVISLGWEYEMSDIIDGGTQITEDGKYIGLADIEIAGLVETPNEDDYILDTDGDGISDIVEEEVLGSSSTSSDTDGDGVSDYSEVFSYGTLVDNADSDGDGLDDGEEIALGTESLESDTDGDGITDGPEVENGLDPLDESDADRDNDGDSLTNAEEINLYDTDINNADTDGDLLGDGDEVLVYATDPTDMDTDGDELNDGDEILTYETDPLDTDSDDDDLLDGEEVSDYLTEPTDSDTDDDGWNDGQEVYASYSKNPLQTDNIIHGQRGHDISGNGYSDIIGYYPDGSHYVVASNEDSLIDGGNWSEDIGDETSIPYVGDFNGDGQSDVATWDVIAGSIEVGLSNGSSISAGSEWSLSMTGASLQVGDFDGDGADDIASHDGAGTWDVYLSTGDEFLNSETWLDSFGSEASNILVGDFDSDGVDDLVAFTSSSGNWDVSLSTGSSFSTASEWLSDFGGDSVMQYVGDFDGDGIEDILIYDGETIKVAQSIGDEFTSRGTVAYGLSLSDQSLIGDFNGDCKSDILFFDSTGSDPSYPNGEWRALLSNGYYFDAENEWSLGSGSIKLFGGCGHEEAFEAKRRKNNWWNDGEKVTPWKKAWKKIKEFSL
jgi:hypothetical protein